MKFAITRDDDWNLLFLLIPSTVETVEQAKSELMHMYDNDPPCKEVLDVLEIRLSPDLERIAKIVTCLDGICETGNFTDLLEDLARHAFVAGQRRPEDPIGSCSHRILDNPDLQHGYGENDPEAGWGD